MKTYWLIVTHQDSPKIDTGRTERIDGTQGEAERAALTLRASLGHEYIVTVETDKAARLYTSYRQFKGSESQAYS